MAQKTATKEADILERFLSVRDRAYERLKGLPKPKSRTIGGTFYGSTEMISKVGNQLDLINGEQHVSYGAYSSTQYTCLWGIRIGGTYGLSEYEELRSFLKKNRAEILSEGYAIIDDYGTNFSVYGIAKK